MAEMAIGHGSEFQLLRYLGHHRQYLNKTIMEQLDIKSGDIQWLDYPVDEIRDSMDGEFKGVECFQNNEHYQSILENWKRFWPQTGNSQNWDGIFTIGDKWFFVEAKAHLAEAHQKCKAGNASRKIIRSAFSQTCGSDNIADIWINSNCYQLANRLAFIHFCEQQHINAELVYILFYNGYRFNPRKNLKPEDKLWEKEIEKDFAILKLSDQLKSKLNIVYIDCFKP